MRLLRGCTPLFVLFFLSACGSLLGSSVATPLPTQYIPTAIALTLQAGGAAPPSDEALQAAEQPSTQVSASSNPGPLEASPTPAPEITLPLASAPASPEVEPGAGSTPSAKPPFAAIQIYKPGDLSRVVSPLHIASYLKSGAGGRVRLELYGEDGRLLGREIKAFNTPAGAWVNLSMDMDFQISAAAELGKLVISVDDQFGRRMAANSVDMLLLSMGEEDINPSDAVYEAIILQQPEAKALIQGGKVLVSGLARLSSDRPLHVELVSDKGQVVGQRLAAAASPEAGSYRIFAVEVPYTVGALTPVRCAVYQDGEALSEPVHLSSLEILLSP